MEAHVAERAGDPAPIPQVSVVVPTYNRSRLLAQCLDSLEAQSLDKSAYEVIAVDDGSTDGTSNLLESAQVDSTLHLVGVKGTHGGPAAARNLGIRRARGGLVAFIDDDCVADRDWLLAIIEPFSKASVAGVEGLVVRHPNCTPYTHFVENTHGRLYLTANMAYRREALESVGGFDEGYPHAAAEDWDLAFRVLQRGWEIRFEPKAKVVHVPVPIDGRYFLARAKERESALRLYRRFPGPWRQTTGHSMRQSFIEGIFFRPAVEARRWKQYFREHPFELPGYLFWQTMASGRLLVEYVRLVNSYGPLDP